MRYLIILLFTILTANAFGQSVLLDHLQHMQSFQAQFTQKTLNSKQVTLQQSHGNMAFEKPGLFRWETFTPTHQIVIINNNTLAIYDVDLAQVTKQSLKKNNVLPATILSSDPSHILSEFTITTINNTTYKLTPKKPNNAFQYLLIAFDHNALSRFSVFTNLNQTNVFQFTNVKVNQPLSATLFTLTFPKDVEVLKA